jgi:NAD(P)-dependent dehydrogenase (short-subunit alcohol dehydrogenase family)
VSSGTTLDKFRLDEKVAIVTGAGGGLGRAIAFALAEAGARVVVVSRTREKGEGTLEMVIEAGGTGIFLKTDVTKSSEVEAMAAETITHFRTVDILVNNAGIQLAKPVLEMKEEDWHLVLDTNLTGAFLCSKFVGKSMVQAKKGKIINISSTAGFAAATNQASYCASKAAIIMFTKSLALEWAKYNINVNAIAPGYLRTSFSASALDDPAIASVLLKRIPLKRFGEAEEISPLVVYLASSASDYMTGETLLIDGGHLCHM